MKREQGEAKPQESPVHDVARDEQLKVHMEKWNETMLKSIQNTSFTNATLPMPNPVRSTLGLFAHDIGKVL